MFSKQPIAQPIIFGLLILIATLATSPSAPVASAKSDTPKCKAEKLDDDDFSRRSTKIDNEFLPLTPGTKLVLQGQSNRGEGLTDHRVEFVVTDLMKVIDGVRTLVLWDRDFQGEELAEAELTFHAQDKQGNVWNLGEYPEEFEGGEFMGAPNTWISGLEKARGGLAIQAKPKLDTKPYLQAKAPDIIWDCGQVLEKGVEACAPLKCFKNVLVIDEWSPADPEGGHQLKYHAPGVGVVQVGAVDDPEGETLVLVEKRKLSKAELKEARNAVLELEERAYEISEVYAQTAPVERLSVANDDDDDDDDD